MNKLATLIAISIALTSCAELQAEFNPNYGKIAVTSEKKETQLSFAQYLSNIAEGKPVAQSIDFRFRKGKNGVLPFEISQNQKFLVSNVEFSCSTGGVNIFPVSEIKKVLKKSKSNLNKVKDCYAGTVFEGSSLQSLLIYKVNINNKILYLKESVSNGASCNGDTTIQISKLLPSCEY